MEKHSYKSLLKAGELERAISLMKEMLDGDLTPQDRVELALTLAETLDWHLADAAGSLAQYESALSEAEAAGLPVGRPALGVGQALHALGRSDEALPYLQRAAASAETPTLKAGAFSARGDILTDMGEYQAAYEALSQGLDLIREQSEPELHIHLLASTALALSRLERFDEAEEKGLEAVSLAKTVADPGLLAICFLRQGQIHYQQDKLAGASYWFQQGVQTAKKAGLTHLEAVFRDALNNLEA